MLCSPAKDESISIPARRRQLTFSSTTAAVAPVEATTPPIKPPPMAIASGALSRGLSFNASGQQLTDLPTLAGFEPARALTLLHLSVQGHHLAALHAGILKSSRQIFVAAEVNLLLHLLAVPLSAEVDPNIITSPGVEVLFTCGAQAHQYIAVVMQQAGELLKGLVPQLLEDIATAAAALPLQITLLSSGSSGRGEILMKGNNMPISSTASSNASSKILPPPPPPLPLPLPLLLLLLKK